MYQAKITFQRGTHMCPRNTGLGVKICTLTYGVILTQAGNNRTESMCRPVGADWKHVYPTARGTESYHIRILSLT